MYRQTPAEGRSIAATAGVTFFSCHRGVTPKSLLDLTVYAENFLSMRVIMIPEERPAQTYRRHSSRF